MKVASKNQNTMISIMAHRPMLMLQQMLASSCLRQDLILESRIGRDEKGVFLSYSVGYNGEGAMINGTARNEKDPHFLAALAMIEGKMISELFPPAVRKVSQEDGEVDISYWKRLLITEVDVTKREGQEECTRQGVWAGFSSDGHEIIRVKDGGINQGCELVDHIQWPVLGARGSCVVVMYRNPEATPTQKVDEQALEGIGALTGAVVKAAVSDSSASTAATSTSPAVSLSNVQVDTSKTLGAMQAATRKVGEATRKAVTAKPAAKKPAAKKTVQEQRREAAVKEAEQLRKASAPAKKTPAKKAPAAAKTTARDQAGAAKLKKQPGIKTAKAK